MPSFKYVMELSEQDKEQLTEIITKGTRMARTILRANILLASDKRNDKYMTVAEIAESCLLNSKKNGKKRIRVASKVGRIIGIFYPPFTHILQRFGR